MKQFAFSHFNFNGQVQIPTGRYTAVGISPSSEVDCCIVGGRRLGPMGLVQYDQNVAPIRSFRQRSNSAALFANDQVGDTLVLQCYEPCDALVPPGPRAPATAYALVQNANLGATPARANLMFRLPFAGRRMAAIHVARKNASADVNIVVRGIRYVPREILLAANAIDGTIYNEFVDEITDTLFAGLAAQAVSVIPQLLATAFDPPLGRTIYVGGVDNQEVYDELEVYVYGASAAGAHVYVSGEAFGEHVL